VQEWIRISDGSAAAEAIREIHRSPVDQIQKATSDYLAAETTRRMLGPTEMKQAWSTPLSPFSPASMADAITAFNDKLDELLTNDMKQLASLGGITSGGVDIISGISTNLLLHPISEPLERGAKVLELIGLAVGLLTSQPWLAIACAKDLARQELTSLLAQTIDKILEGPSAADILRATIEDEGDQAADTTDPLSPLYALS